MEFVAELGLFLAKAVIIVGGFLVVVSAIAGLALKAQRRTTGKGELSIEHVNDSVEVMQDALMAEILEKKAYKNWEKYRESVKKKASKTVQETQLSQIKALDDNIDTKKAGLVHTPKKTGQPRLFVVTFHGDVQASEAEQLAHTIDAALIIAQPGDCFFCELESAGGLVHGYGFAASQLRRIKDAGYRLTVSIDKVAASGGYMMACVADRILAAPFSIIGSIGVVAQMPNFNRVLKKHEIDLELHTAGEYKRTLTLFGENTPEGREKFKQDLEETHVLFKQFVTRNRPMVDIDRVATGEHWYGEQAIDLKLVDELKTSQDFLLESVSDFAIYRLRYEVKTHWLERLGLSASKAVSSVLTSMKSSWNL